MTFTLWLASHSSDRPATFSFPQLQIVPSGKLVPHQEGLPALCRHSLSGPSDPQEAHPNPPWPPTWGQQLASYPGVIGES